MAVDVERLVLQMSADLRRFEKGMDRARKATETSTRAIERRFDTMNTRVRRSSEEMSRGIQRAIAAIGLTVAVRDVADYADAWTNLRNTVRQYEAVVGPVDAATRRLIQVSSDAGVAVESLGFVFGATSRAAIKLGADGERVFEFVEAVGKGSAIANTGVSGVSGAMVQLSQAISSPKVQLQEFNSIIEGTPRLAQAFADGVEGAGGDIAKLREMIASGDVSGQELFSGLLSQLDTLRSEFDKVDTSIGRALTTLRNATIEYVGTVDQGLGASARLAGLIETIADNLELLGAAATATVLVLGGKGAIGAIDAFAKKIKSIEQAAALEAAALRDAAAAAGEKAAQEARIGALGAAEVKRLRDRVATLNATIAKDVQHTAGLKRIRDAEVELAAARTHLDTINGRLTKNEGARMLNLRVAELAARRVTAAETELQIARQSASAPVRSLVQAQQELAVAQAAQARSSGALAVAQQTYQRATRVATGATIAFRQALAGTTAFLAGPIGTIALIAATTFALRDMGNRSVTTADALDDLNDSVNRYREAQAGIAEDTKALETAQKALKEAIESQAPAAEEVARIEVDAINRRIAANQRLASTYESLARAQLAEAEQRRGRDDFRDRLGLTSSLMSLGRIPNTGRRLNDANLAFDIARGADQSVNLPALIEQERANIIAAQDAGEALSDAQVDFLRTLADLEAREAQILAQRQVVQNLASAAQGDPGQTVAGGGGGGGGGDAGKLNQYRSDLEKFRETVAEIGASQEVAANKSRAAVQALLDYASATGDVAAAYEQLPSIRDILVGDDAALLSRELTKLAEDAADAVRTGEDKLVADLKADVDDILQARSAAVAAGVQDLSQFDRALDTRIREYQEAVREFISVGGPAGDGPLDVSGLTDVSNAPEFEVIGEEFRRVMRDAVKNAMREGIQTDDWGTAFRGILADAVVAGMEDALDKLGDFLADILLGANGKGGLISSFGSAVAGGFGYGGAKAFGGGVDANKFYRVNEAGKGEFLYLNRPGEVMTADKMHAMSAGRGVGPVTIHSPLIVQGSIDHATKTEVMAAINSNNAQIMAALPRAIDGRVNDSIVNRRLRR